VAEGEGEGEGEGEDEGEPEPVAEGEAGASPESGREVKAAFPLQDAALRELSTARGGEVFIPAATQRCAAPPRASC